MMISPHTSAYAAIEFWFYIGSSLGLLLAVIAMALDGRMRRVAAATVVAASLSAAPVLATSQTPDASPTMMVGDPCSQAHGLWYYLIGCAF